VVVVQPPAIHEAASLGKRVEDLRRQQVVAQPDVGTRDDSVLPQRTETQSNPDRALYVRPEVAVRIVPMTPELRPILQALIDQTPEGSEAVVPRLIDPTTNLRTTFLKLIARAGYEPNLRYGPRLFHNMRASCATDWAETLPSHVVARLKHRGSATARWWRRSPTCRRGTRTSKGRFGAGRGACSTLGSFRRWCSKLRSPFAGDRRSFRPSKSWDLRDTPQTTSHPATRSSRSNSLQARPESWLAC
jgi:hypothetical protein